MSTGTSPAAWTPPPGADPAAPPLRASASRVDRCAVLTITDTLDQFAKQPHVRAVVSPFSPEGARQIAAGRTIAYGTLRLDQTVSDYKTSDVRDQRKAHQRARESLQLQIYAMAYEAISGRLPDALQLHFLDTGVTGRATIDGRRLAKARDRIGAAAAGIRARDYTPKPDRTTCGYCPFRTVCPSSVAT